MTRNVRVIPQPVGKPEDKDLAGVILDALRETEDVPDTMRAAVIGAAVARHLVDKLAQDLEPKAMP